MTKQRKLLTAALVILALHLIQEVFLGVSPLGSFIANFLQIFSAGLAAFLCFRASRRGTGFIHQFWILIACGFLVWACADMGWVYYESFRHTEPPRDSIFPFLVTTRSLFLAMALLLDQKEEDKHFDLASLLDFVQLIIIFSLIYIGWFYVPSLHETSLTALLRSAEVEIGEDLAVLGLAFLQAKRAPTPQIRWLYLGFTSYLSILTLGSIVTAYAQLHGQTASGTWLDLWWTVAHLVGAYWALRWQPRAGFYPSLHRERSFASMLLENAIFAGAPLIVLWQAAELGPFWRKLSFTFLGISILAFGARLALSKFREAQSGATAHKADRERLEAESNFRIAFQASPAAITVTSLDDGTYSEVNDAFLAVLGYGRSELIGKSALDLNIWVDPQERLPIVEKLRAGQQVSEAEVRFRTKSGKERQLVMSSDLVLMRGQPFILSIMHDVTEKKMLEREFHQAQKMEAVGRLAGGVAHDFNNLLMVVSGNAQLLQASKDDEDKVVRYARQIEDASARGAALTRQLLAFSRKQLLNPTVLDLNTVIADLWKMLPRLLGEDIDGILSLEPELRRVSADRGQIEQVIMNLAVNARDAMPQGGKLALETANVVIDSRGTSGHSAEIPPGRYVSFAMTDTGEGMSPAVRAHIFDPFFTTKELGKGTGLGLATVHGIVKQSGGYISVSSEPGKGSTFKVYLPQITGHAAEHGSEAQGEPAQGGRGTILLVEDEIALRQIASEYLREKGYHVVEAGTSESALEACASYAGRIDLLVTDIVIPGGNGLTLAKQLSEMRPGLRTIFMSGYTDRTLGPDILGPSATFFQKPFSLDALAHTIRVVLDGAG